MDGSRADPGANPLAGSAREFDRVIEALGPAALLLVVERRMGPALRERTTPDDILQDALLHAWRDRASHRWRGLPSFRTWILSIIDNRIADTRDHVAALKRGGGVRTLSLAAGTTDSENGWNADLPRSTTPSRIAWRREQADAIRAALDGLPDDLREVVRLRLVEQVGIEDIAAQLGLGASAVRHRFRRGSELFRHRLTSALGSQDGQAHAQSTDTATQPGPDSSPIG